MSDEKWRERARNLIPGMGCKTVTMDEFFKELEEGVVTLGREMADERAEEIARRLDRAQIGCSACGEAGTDAARIARSTITKPKTREQVLEEALRKICSAETPFNAVDGIARRALEYKSDHQIAGGST